MASLAIDFGVEDVHLGVNQEMIFRSLKNFERTLHCIFIACCYTHQDVPKSEV